MAEESPYEIQGWDIGVHEFALSVRVNGCHFTIAVTPDSFVDSPAALARFRAIFEHLAAGTDEVADVWEYSEGVADAFLGEFAARAPDVGHTGVLTLADLATKASFEAEYRVVGEQPAVGAVEARDPESEVIGEWDIRPVAEGFPVYAPADVEVPYVDGSRVFDIEPQRVLVRGQQYQYKKCWSPLDPIDEVTKYAKIAAAGPAAGQLRISRLAGIVAKEGGQTRGMLYDWVEIGEYGNLSSIMSTEVPADVREKWTSQIRSTVAGLHAIGVVWGDVNADNVVIDANGDALVVDLEGGATRGWVDVDVADTPAGDLQGVERLVDFIVNDESPLRLPDESDDEEEDDDDAMDQD